MRFLVSQAKLVISVKKGKSDNHSAHPITPMNSQLLTKDSILAAIQLDIEDNDDDMN